jgi:hypothetical protein
MTSMLTDRKQTSAWAVAVASVLALGAFAWPFALAATPEVSRLAVTAIALALVPTLVVVVSMVLDRSLRSASAIALLGVLAAVGSIVRITTVGVAGVETIFIVLILAGRVLGARFAFLLGLITVAVSSVIMGSIGPWTPFQMFACAWVGAGAGLLPFKKLRGWRELALLASYGLVAAYIFGALMNLWFWPFAVGTGTTISYDTHASALTNLSHFGLYTLITSTLTWDTVRAVTTVLGTALIGSYVLRALRRTRA